MANYSLKELTPLGGHEPRVDRFEGVSIAENTGCVLASLSRRNGKESGFKAATKRMFETTLPKPNHMVSKGDFTLFCTGPEQWFVEAPLESHDDIAGALLSEFKDNASITEQSGGWVRFDLMGPACVDVFQRLCAVDTATMKSNEASRSVIEHIGVFLLCRKSGSEFSVYGPRSSAGSLHHALVGAAISVG